MSVPDKVLGLVERFERNLPDYKRGKYNETQVRREFIDPFFKALGWDIDNEEGYAEAYKDVVHEDAIKVGGGTKAPDYCFRVGGARKFFLEAKKPAINIKEDIHPAFQLRRYAWSSKLPLSILTDFEELAVYDCRIKPDKGDKASKARVQYITFREYAGKWGELYATFSKEAVLKGSFDKYVELNKTKRGTAEVDDAFLTEIERWRDLLARNIALRNPEITQRQLNYAVQLTIDRLIFLRICEDRGIEHYGQLRDVVSNSDIYARLIRTFRDADDRYNSGLFHFREEKARTGAPDTLTPGLTIDDKSLKDIIQNLYYPDSPYEFAVLPANILGQVYEQFLGKVIRLTAGHRAVVEEKPEVRKAGGVYYTPTFIVERIVQDTLGKKLEGRKSDYASKLKILDPACGSGSFLIGAYQHLLDWHLDWYVNNEPEKLAKKRRPPIYRSPQGDWKLTIDERKKILLNSIHGVDIDAQAVEVTKLSLLLKVLEGESEQTLGQQLQIFRERVLPDLDENIKCGNSLIGYDFYQGQQMSLLDDEEMYRINVFDWSEGFPGVMKAGGFDVVIGNPPYIRIQAMKEWAPVEVEFYKKRYKTAKKGNYDIYVVFVEKGMSVLRKGGLLGFILPHKFFNAKYGESLRRMLSEGRHLRSIVHFGHQQVFRGATTYTCLLFLSRTQSKQFHFAKIDDLDEWRLSGTATEGDIPAKVATSGEWNFCVGEGAELFKKLRKIPHTLKDSARIFQGLVTGADKIFILDDPMDIEDELLHPYLKTDKLTPYDFPSTKKWILFPYDLVNDKASLIPAKDFIDRYPRAWKYLKSNEQALRGRERGKWNHDQWYAFGRSQNLTQMEGEKLIIQVMALRPTVIYDNRSLYMTGGGSGPFYGIKPQAKWGSTEYLQGILNSKLFGFIISCQSTVMRGGYLKFSKQYIETAPIPIINPKKPGNQDQADKLKSLVKKMITLHERLAKAGSAHNKSFLKRQITAIDNQIDQVVYQLYGLTDEEIRIVEGETH